MMAASESPGTSGSEIPATTGDQIGVGAKTRRPRLYYLDGLRGLAAFYVLLFHATTVMTTGHSKVPLPLQIITVLANRGHFGVVVFIVLSGLSLMLPMAMAGDARLSGGFGNYVRRRARRILPPYYAALVFSIAILAGFNTFGPRLGLGSKVEPTALSPGSVLSHVSSSQSVVWLGVPNQSSDVERGYEWQIYFILALGLLPLIRRTNILVVVGAAWIITSLPQFFLPDAYNFYWAGPWLVGSFTLGMLGAVIGFSPSVARVSLAYPLPVGLVGGRLHGQIVVVLVATGRADAWPGPVADLAVSLFAMCIINACWAPSARIVSAPPVSAPAVSAPPLSAPAVSAVPLSAPAGSALSLSAAPESAPPGRLAKVLGSRSLVFLGGFSYSVYLIQHPVLRLTEKVFPKAGFGRTATILGDLILVVPLILALGWLFSEFFERPFTHSGTLLPALRRKFGLDHERPRRLTLTLASSPPTVTDPTLDRTRCKTRKH